MMEVREARWVVSVMAIFGGTTAPCRNGVPWAAMTVDKFRQQNAAQNAAEREFGMCGYFVVFDEAGKLEKGSACT